MEFRDLVLFFDFALRGAAVLSVTQKVIPVLVRLAEAHVRRDFIRLLGKKSVRDPLQYAEHISRKRMVGKGAFSIEIKGDLVLRKHLLRRGEIVVAGHKHPDREIPLPFRNVLLDQRGDPFEFLRFVLRLE